VIDPLLDVLIERVEDDAVVGSSLNTPAAPLGNPATLRSTDDAKFVREMGIVKLVPCPCFTDWLVGDADTVKSGVGGGGGGGAVPLLTLNTTTSTPELVDPRGSSQSARIWRR